MSILVPSSTATPAPRPPVSKPAAPAAVGPPAVTAAGPLSPHCCCACACACWPPCSIGTSGAHWSGVVESVRVEYTYDGARRATGAPHAFATSPCKIVLLTNSLARHNAQQHTMHAEADKERWEHDTISALGLAPADGGAPAGAAGAPLFSSAAASSAFRAASSLNSSRASVSYVVSYGGGICPRDKLRQSFHLHTAATALVTTQGMNKVFADTHTHNDHTHTPKHTTHTQQSMQQQYTPAQAVPAPVTALVHVRVRMDAHSLLLWLPDPTMLYAGARYSAPTFIDMCDDDDALLHVPAVGAVAAAASSSSPLPALASSSTCTPSLVWLDWLYAGRVARGERWDAAHYSTQLHLHFRRRDAASGQECITPILLESLLLEQEESAGEQQLPRAPHSTPSQSGERVSPLARRLWPYLCFASVFLIGARVEALASRIHQHVTACHLRTNSSAARDKSKGSAATQPKVLLSSQWIDVALQAGGEARSAGAAHGASRPTHVRGCVLRVAGQHLPDVQLVLQLYLAALEPCMQVAPPWATH